MSLLYSKGESIFYYFSNNLRIEISCGLFNFEQVFVVDAVSIYFLLILYFIYILCILYITLNYKILKKNLYIYVTSLFIILHLLFMSDNLYFFFCLYELSLLPLILIILSYGSKERKTYASFLLFYYTMFSSILFLFSIIYIDLKYGSSSLVTLIYEILPVYNIQNFFDIRDFFIFLALVIAFCIKIPTVPFHTWLTEAHVEAPTVGSILLASLILKIGIFAFLKIIIPIFPLYITIFKNYFIIYFLFSVLYISIIIFSVYDLKKIIAYFSIIHMNFALIGLFTMRVDGINGFLLLVFSHSFSSTLFFLLVGLLYDAFKTRDLIYFSGLGHYSKKFMLYFFIACMINVGFPCAITFLGEMLLLRSILFENLYIFYLGLFSLFLNFAVTFLLFIRLFAGSNIISILYSWKEYIFMKKNDLNNSISYIHHAKEIQSLFLLVKKNEFLILNLLAVLILLFFINQWFFEFICGIASKKCI